jgi:pimeloyl-ACP methyl ester carboxylesterase
MTTEWTTEAKGAGAYAEVNGINLYYEIHGSGRPLVLLHGGLGATEMFGPALVRLAEGHRVIGVDLQGHGRTADVDRPMRLETLADDILALLDHLELPQVDAVGYSLGGGVAFQLAVRHPERVRKLVVVSAASGDEKML